MNTLPNFFEKLFPLKSFQTLKEYFEYYTFRENIACLDEPLFYSEERKKWVSFYPDLNEFPETQKYIDDSNKACLTTVSNELSNVQLFLAKGQVLFHSGFLPEGIELAIGKEFNLKKVFSTTVDPYIANVHDSSDDVYWYITITNNNIRCLPIPDEYGEYEVIILDSPKARITDIVKEKRDPYWNGFKSPIEETKTIIYVELE